MIDFQNASYLKLRPVADKAFGDILGPLLIPGEQILGSFQSVRDGVVFTNRRILTVNVQGLTGKKKDITTLPYSKIQSFAIETAGVVDLDSELVLWFSGLGQVRFEFAARANVAEICRIISQQVL